jgi:hypothetical protein
MCFVAGDTVYFQYREQHHHPVSFPSARSLYDAGTPSISPSLPPIFFFTAPKRTPSSNLTQNTARPHRTPAGMQSPASSAAHISHAAVPVQVPVRTSGTLASSPFITLLGPPCGPASGSGGGAGGEGTGRASEPVGQPAVTERGASVPVGLRRPAPFSGGFFSLGCGRAGNLFLHVWGFGWRSVLLS